MADLDYAFIADYAQIEGDKLSVIGASFTHVVVKSLDGLFVVSVAGRVRMRADEEPAELGFRVVGGDGFFEITNTVELMPSETAKPYGDNKVGVLFATSFALPIFPGLCEVFLSLNGEEVRRLAFDIAHAD